MCKLNDPYINGVFSFLTKHKMVFNECQNLLYSNVDYGKNYKLSGSLHGDGTRKRR